MGLYFQYIILRIEKKLLYYASRTVQEEINKNASIICFLIIMITSVETFLK